MSGSIGEPIDIPSFRWQVTISNCSLSTTRDKGVGGLEASGLNLPWTAVPGGDLHARRRALASYRRSIVVMWDDGKTQVPVVVGAIGERVDGYFDTSFELVSMMNLLGQRYLVREGAFGNGNPAGTTTQNVTYRNRSLRGIASEIGVMCTDEKPGGSLPIDWTYVGEAGSHERTYYGFNVANNSYAKLLEDITNVHDGPDAQLRPYITEDGTHVRHRLVMGSDAHPALDQTGITQTLTFFPGGGTIENVKVAHTAPVSRVFAHGAGEDQAKLTHLSEDATLLSVPDPWPLIEEVVGFGNDDSLALLKSHASARLEADARPLAQLEGDIWLDDPRVPSLHDIWTGQLVDIDCKGHPGLPDGVYNMRLMEMSGDETSRVHLTFDPIVDPWEV